MIGVDIFGKRIAQAATPGTSARSSSGSLWQCETGNPTPRVSGVLHALASAWKWFEQKRVQQSAMRRLRISETISLGEKRSIWIVQVDEQDYLIGASSGNLALLATLQKQPSFKDTLHHRAQSAAEQA